METHQLSVSTNGGAVCSPRHKRCESEVVMGRVGVEGVREDLTSPQRLSYETARIPDGADRTTPATSGNGTASSP